MSLGEGIFAAVSSIALVFCLGLSVFWETPAIAYCNRCGAEALRAPGGVFAVMILVLMDKAGLMPHCPECSGMGPGGMA